MESEIKVLVLMSVYNGDKYLDKQLKSIFQQYLPDNYSLKLIIRDDGSSDNSEKIIDRWRDKIDIVYKKGTNIGAKESFYDLLYTAPHSDYYAFCDQDDIWLEDKLWTAIQNMNKDTEKPMLYFSNLEYIDEYDNKLNRKLLADGFKLSLKRILMCNPANGCSMVWNNSLHKNLTKKRYVTFTMHDEYVITIAILTGSVIYDSNCRMLYRLHSQNVTQKKNLIKKLKLWKWVWFDNRYATLDKRSSELLEKLEIENKDFKNTLIRIANYKNGFNRLDILKDDFYCENRAIQRSFRLRMLLGFI